LFLDSMGGGAWPFLVGGVICLVNSDNERDLNLLNSNNRSVMPLDVLGRTRATLMKSSSTYPLPEGMGNLLKLHRDGDRALQLLLFNEESL
ncbi:14641_t:CDS:2, partial [Racocetra fulgida]